ncbi:hypothetical protein CCMSSC00406_0001727 [Pleurotus cornucopiae]|uniref:Uncharacterized protein n=1 Tax=Pleurotus cornucopiae TaxID=5321 RepID=A0ACB7IM79_PLECO|nr:hypothetical protein CCMSSC00406_0001727 [Pleurotus cornucopiae]
MTRIRGLLAALNSDGRYKFKAPEFAIDHLVVGGGVVGLAIAEALVKRFPKKTTFLVERNPRVGEEISSRNSEVIHAGLYYPPDSLKTKACLVGRQLLYELCDRHGIAYKKTGKLVVATKDRRPYIEGLHAKAQKLQWPTFASSQRPPNSVLPTRLLNSSELHEMQPGLSKELTAALWSPETGIVDSHGLMETLEKEILDSDGGEVVASTRVVRVDPHTPSPTSPGHGWVVQMVTGDSAEADAVLARTVINSSGLAGPFLLNSLLPRAERIPMYYARGSYASYHGPGVFNISHLIYPCPETGPNAHAFQSLGTHLTLDLQGKVRFGPDIEWLSPTSRANSGEENEDAIEGEESVDFWKEHLVPNESRIAEMHAAVLKYLPGVTVDGMQPDYVGIRPKLVPPAGGFQDFVIRTDYPSNIKGNSPLISLLGIESPGLTSSLALGKMVAGIVEQHGGDSENLA